GDDELVVVERQSARDAVFVELEADGVDRRLLAAFRLLALVEIADGHWPARNRRKPWLVVCGIRVLALVRPELVPDHRERVVALVAAVRAVIDGEIKKSLSSARRLDHAHHVLSWKYDAGVEVECPLFRLHETDRSRARTMFGMAVNGIDEILVEEVFRA